MADKHEHDDEIQKQLDGSAKAYCNGDPAFFDYFADDATVFSAGTSEALKGREAYRHAFAPKLKGKREVKILEQSRQWFGERVVIAQTAQITHEGITANIRQTMVWGRSNKGWLVNHLHTALIGSPFSNEVPKSVNAIRVLNERVATMAGVLGVAQ